MPGKLFLKRKFGK